MIGPLEPSAVECAEEGPREGRLRARRGCLVAPVEKVDKVRVCPGHAALQSTPLLPSHSRHSLKGVYVLAEQPSGKKTHFQERAGARGSEGNRPFTCRVLVRQSSLREILLGRTVPQGPMAPGW